MCFYKGCAKAKKFPVSVHLSQNFFYFFQKGQKWRSKNPLKEFFNRYYIEMMTDGFTLDDPSISKCFQETFPLSSCGIWKWFDKRKYVPIKKRWKEAWKSIC